MNSYRDLFDMAEDAVKKIKDRDLKKEAFRLLIQRLLSGERVVLGGYGTPDNRAFLPKRGPGRPPLPKPNMGIAYPRPKRPGRAGGGLATTSLNKLIAGKYFKIPRDAASVMRDMAKKNVYLEPSQIRMEMLRFARSGKLKRKIRMKGQKVTYVYSQK